MSQLDDLFKQAKEIPVSYSIDDTLASLEKSTGKKFPKASRLGKWSLTKKLLIMTSLILSVVTAVVLLPEPKETLTKSANDKMINDDSPKMESEMILNGDDKPERTIIEELERDAFNMELELLPLQKLKPKNRDVRMPQFQPYHQYRQGDEDFIPSLNEEQRKANERQKQKMLRAIGKRDKKDYAYIPSSSIKMFGKETSIQSFYIQTTEVSNLEYRTFLFDLIIQGRTKEFLIARPDQHKWTTITTADLNPMEEMYFSHEAYNDYPVVNISHDGAKMYCAWLSESYEKSEYAKKYGQVERARIPEYEEWYLAATNAGQDTIYPWGGAFPRNADGCYLANYRPKIEDYDEDGGFYTVKVDSYNPNKFGVYNLVGNATEMVISKNAVLHAGGSWMSPLDELKLNIPDNLVERKEPHPADGFRIVFTHLGRGYRNTK